MFLFCLSEHSVQKQNPFETRRYLNKKWNLKTFAYVWHFCKKKIYDINVRYHDWKLEEEHQKSYRKSSEWIWNKIIDWGITNIIKWNKKLTVRLLPTNFYHKNYQNQVMTKYIFYEMMKNSMLLHENKGKTREKINEM